MLPNKKRKARRIQPVKSCTVLCPSNFRIELIINQIKGKNDYKRNLVDACYYILHLLVSFQRRKDKQDEYEKIGYYVLSSKLLKKICGNNYHAAALLLQQTGIIEINNPYSSGHFSKGYRLSAPYNSASYVVISLSANSNANKNFLNWTVETLAKNELKLQAIPYITQWYNNNRLTVDLEQAHHVLEFYRYKLLKAIPSNYTIAQNRQFTNRVNYRYNNVIESLKKIDRGDFNLVRTGQDHRLHSAVTSLKKEFRPFLRFDNNPLIGIDIKASQPYLFTSLFYKTLYEKRSKENYNIKAIYRELYNRHKQRGTIMYPRSIQLIDSKEDISVSSIAFHHIKWEEDFYSYLQELEESRYSPGERLFINRQVTKQSIMIILYSKSRGKKYYSIFLRFKELFPHEAAMIEYYTSISNEDSVNYLPILMQRMESYLMLNEVCKEVTSKCPDAPIIPIHDSILTTPVYVEQVQKVIESTLESLTGIKPGLKIEDGSSKDIYNNLEKLIDTDFKEILGKLNKRSFNEIPDVVPQEPLLKKNPVWKGEIIQNERYLRDLNVEVCAELLQAI